MLTLNDDQRAFLASVSKGRDGVTAAELLERVEQDGESNPFYAYVFEHDDDAAARLFRLERCGYILRSWVDTKIDPRTRETVALRQVMHVQTSPEREAYIRTGAALRKKDTREQLEAECRTMFDSWRRKWSAILGAEFVDEVISSGGG